MSLVELITVASVERLTPRMTRVTFTGEGVDAIKPWPDQQLKLLFPPADRPLVLPKASAEGDGMSWYQAYLSMPAEDRPTMRSFTVRALTDDALVIDFVLHDHGGPASTGRERPNRATCWRDTVLRRSTDRTWHWTPTGYCSQVTRRRCPPSAHCSHSPTRRSW